jgi:hypothetical protein
VATNALKGNKKRKQQIKVKDKTTANKDAKESKKDNIFFNKAACHIKKLCSNYYAWRAKKGMSLSLVCSEINLNYVSTYS